MTKFRGADWVEQATGKPLSPLGRKVADLLGQVTRGIYHISAIVHRTDWGGDHHIALIARGGFLGCLGTFDGSELTELVVLCHDQCLRLEISPALEPYEEEGDYEDQVRELKEAVKGAGCEPDDVLGMPVLHLLFTQRRGRTGSLALRHPSLEHAIESARALGAALEPAQVPNV